MDYQGRTALITGASAGLGTAFARALAQRGADLVITARREERLRALAEELSGTGVNVTVLPADLSVPGAAARLFDQMAARRIVPDILINNAGYGLPGGFGGTNWPAQQDFLQVMVSSPAELAHRAFRAMQAQGWGRVVNVASLAGMTPGGPGHTLYGASKAFLINMSEALTAEANDSDIRIIAACPGLTYTEFHDANGTRNQISKAPTWLFMTAEDVVDQTLRALEGGKTVFVPGVQNKAIATLFRLLPRPIGQRLMAGQSRRYRGSSSKAASSSSEG